MKINQNYSSANYNKYNNFSFGSCIRTYPNHSKCLAGKEIYTTTQLFRKDLDFGKLADTIINNFADKDKVQIYCLAGSDGSEAYSLAIALMERIPKDKYNKYFPIISMDKDAKVLEAAQKGRINLSKKDLEALEKEVKSGKKYFINPKKAINIDNDLTIPDFCMSYEAVPELKNAVVFKQGNLTQEIKNIKDDGNTVALCRNVFPYLHSSQTSNVIYDMNKTLKPGSIFVIGNFDKNTEIKNYLYYYDFRQLQENVFQHR